MYYRLVISGGLQLDHLRIFDLIISWGFYIPSRVFIKKYIPYPLQYTTLLELTTHLLKFQLNAHFLVKKWGFGGKKWVFCAKIVIEYAPNSHNEK